MTEILGEPVFRQVADIPDQIDIVDVFRSAKKSGHVRSAGKSGLVRSGRCACAVCSSGHELNSICCIMARRRPDDVLQHVDDIIAAKPAIVWLQSGIRNPQAEEAFAKAGMKVRYHPVCREFSCVAADVVASGASAVGK